MFQNSFLHVVISFIKQYSKFFTRLGVTLLALIIIGVTIFVAGFGNREEHTEYDEMNDSLLVLQLFISRNHEYLDEVIKYVDEPTPERLKFIQYREFDVKDEWLSARKEIRNGKNKNVFGERKLTNHYYTYMSERERDILRNYYYYVEETLRLVKEYDDYNVDNKDPKELKKVVNDIISNSDDADEKMDVIFTRYIRTDSTKEL